MYENRIHSALYSTTDGVVERMNKMMIKSTKWILKNIELPNNFRVEAINILAFVQDKFTGGVANSMVQRPCLVRDFLTILVFRVAGLLFPSILCKSIGFLVISICSPYLFLENYISSPVGLSTYASLRGVKP